MVRTQGVKSNFHYPSYGHVSFPVGAPQSRADMFYSLNLKDLAKTFFFILKQKVTVSRCIWSNIYHQIRYEQCLCESRIKSPGNYFELYLKQSFVSERLAEKNVIFSRREQNP